MKGDELQIIRPDELSDIFNTQRYM